MLNAKEVFVVARQSRLKPGLRSTGRLGLIEKMSGTDLGANEDAVITAIPKDKTKKLVEVIRNGMDLKLELFHKIIL
jgi:hypothetical protein